MSESIRDDGCVYRHPSALLYGRVRLAAGCSIWPNVVMRAEAHEIVVGEDSNIQDFVMIHVGFASPSIIGRNCSITHHCTVHGATVEDDCLIGIGATLMDGAVIGAGSVVAGHSIVTEGTVAPPYSVVAGVPAKVVGERDARVANRLNAFAYRRNGEAYARGDYEYWSTPEFAKQIDAERERLEALLAG